jgi:hypothetical protein
MPRYASRTFAFCAASGSADFVGDGLEDFVGPAVSPPEEQLAVAVSADSASSSAAVW